MYPSPMSWVQHLAPDYTPSPFQYKNKTNQTQYLLTTRLFFLGGINNYRQQFRLSSTYTTTNTTRTWVHWVPRYNRFPYTFFGTFLYFMTIRLNALLRFYEVLHHTLFIYMKVLLRKNRNFSKCWTITFFKYFFYPINQHKFKVLK